MSWAGTNNAKVVDLLSPVARAYNNILAMLLATIGLAIPLTANMHTPKLIEMFLRDRLNQAVLIIMAAGAANVIWVDYLIGPRFAPMWAVRVALYELGADALLELADLTAQRLLGEVQPLRGAREVELLRNRDQRAQVA